MSNTIRFKPLRTALAALGMAAIAPAVAIASTEAPASSHCTAAEHRQFDFWLGDWDTFEAEDPDGPSIARARVERIAGGCAIRELYEQNDGLIGDSILSYDAVRKQWQQTWVTNRGSLMMIWGNFKDGEMVLEGEVHLQNGTSVLQRITWKVEGDSVRETAVLSKDEGATWAPAFDVIFRKRAAASAAVSTAIDAAKDRQVSNTAAPRSRPVPVFKAE